MSNYPKLAPNQPLEANLHHLRMQPRTAIQAFGYEWARATAASAYDELTTLRAQLSAMRAQRDEAVAALKWMAQRGAHVAWSLDCEVCNVWLPAERDETPARPADGYPQKCYATWEEAITAASGLSLASLKEQA